MSELPVSLCYIDDVRNENVACGHTSFARSSHKISAVSVDVDRRFGAWMPAVDLATTELLRIIGTPIRSCDHAMIVSDWVERSYVVRGSIERSQRFWKSGSGRDAPAGLTRGPEFEVMSEPGVLRFATVGVVSPSAVAESIEWVRASVPGRHLVCLPASTPLDKELVTMLYELDLASTALDPSGFAPFAQWVTENQGIYIRVWGFFDDQELSLQAYYRPDLIDIPNR